MMTNPLLSILLNGSEYPLAGPISLAELLARLEMPTRHVAVELNETLVPRGEHSAVHLRPGDRVEIVTLVGGG
jgi:thiamine biosynthesis protein ThiS